MNPNSPRRSPKSVLPVVLLLGACTAFVACGRHKLHPDEVTRNNLFAEILRREDSRLPGDDAFFSGNLAGSPYTEVRERCAIALGRIGNPKAFPWLYDALGSEYAGVRASAAFAVGEIEDRETLRQEGRSLGPLTVPRLTRLLDDPSLAVQMRAVEALGKVGSQPEAANIAERLDGLHYDGSPVRASYIRLAITALMRLRAPAAFPVIEKLAARGNPEIQWMAANALVRMRDKAAAPIFVRLLASPDPDVQAYAARGLGICEDPRLAMRLVPLLPPRDKRTGMRIPLIVRASAAQSLGGLKNPAAVPAIVNALEAEPADGQHPDQVNFAIQAASALGSIRSIESAGILARLSKSAGPVANSAVVALAQVLSSDPERFFTLVNPGTFTSPAAKRAWAQALGALGGARAADELRQMLARSMQKTADELRGMLARSASMRYEEQLARIVDRSLEKTMDRSDLLAVPAVIAAFARMGAPDLNDVVELFLTSHDPVILRAAVAAYKPRPGAPEPWAPVVLAWRTALEAGDLEAETAVLVQLEPWIKEAHVQETLRSALRDRQRNVRIVAARLLRGAGDTQVKDDPGPEQIAATPAACNAVAIGRLDRTVAVLETSRGNIEIELFREDAPLTVANFVSLAKRGFYDGLSFMRVVPFFVIQGGDPRNDQEGGPGYAIRCEINMRPYGRGSVGMALSGKDTGGSQFFITLAPQPHLDGGYTCFGRVISGMQVADRITPGDRINKVTIQEDVTFFDYRSY